VKVHPSVWSPGSWISPLQTHLQLSLSLALLTTFAVSLFAGPTGFGLPTDPMARWLILTEIRFPRAVLGLLVGGGLGLAGAALQGYLRNPLAEPGLMGVSGGAALGAVLSIHLGMAGAFALALPLAGLVGAALSTLAVLLLAGDRSGPVALMLAGVAISSLTGALTALALNLSNNPFAAAEAVFWMMGSLADRSTTQLWLAGPLIVAGSWLLLGLGRTLDGLTLGEDVAATLGLDLEAARQRLIAGTALTVGAATAVTGMIGFIGLVVPHVLRPLTGQSPSRLLRASALGGAILLLSADIAVRLLAPWIDVRVGVLTAVLGAPFFLWLVVRLRADLRP
jgi:iron complex transport system permease protein